MHSQGTQCKTESRSLCFQLGRERWREDVHRSSVHAQGNCYLLTVQDGFSRFSSAYPIPNKGDSTVARTLVGEHFAVDGLTHQIHSDNGLEFVNSLRKELFSEFKISHTTTPV